MIAIHLQGRLGNQLFQYAFIKNASIKLNVHFFIDQSVEKFYLSDYFELKAYSFSFIDQYIFSIRGYKNLFSYYFKNWFYNFLVNQFLKTKLELDLDPRYPLHLLTHLKDNCLYKGYFQSPLFFKQIEPKISEEFSVKKQFLLSYQEKYNHVLKNKKIISLHVRKGDYQNLPSSYYHAIIDQYKDEENTLFIFVSDDYQFIEKEFSKVSNKLISKDTEINDFLHLMLSDVCITANSTFSWWAAYLNQKKNKVIHCPKYFLGFKLKKEYPPNIYPKDWIQHEVD
jgi:hypothetical protein